MIHLQQRCKCIVKYFLHHSKMNIVCKFIAKSLGGLVEFSEQRLQVAFGPLR
jgi:hypothetical protein